MRHRWLVPDGTQITHTGPLYGPTVVLSVAPVAQVTTVAVSGPWVGATPTELAEGVGYAVTDAAEAVLRVEGGWSGWPEPARVAVAYTLPVDEPVPDDVALACTRTVAAWMGAVLPPPFLDGTSPAALLASGIRRFSVGQELTVELADGGAATGGSGAPSGTAGGVPGPLPSDAVALLVPYGYPTAGRIRFA